MGRYQVIDSETGISLSYHATKEEAEKVAENMQAYHKQSYHVDLLKTDRIMRK